MNITKWVLIIIFLFAGCANNPSTEDIKKDEMKFWGKDYDEYVWLKKTAKDIKERRSFIDFSRKRLESIVKFNSSLSVHKGKDIEKLSIVISQREILENKRRILEILILKYNDRISLFYKDKNGPDQLIRLIENRISKRFDPSDFREVLFSGGGATTTTFGTTEEE